MFSSDIATPVDAVGAFANSFATGSVSNNLAVPDPTQWSTLQMAVAVLATPLAIIAVVVVFSGARWSLWLLLSFTISFMRMAYSVYQGVRIMMDLGVLTAFKFGYKIATLFSTTKKSLLARPFSQSREPRVLQARIACATSHEEYLAAAKQLDSIEGLDKWRTDDSDFHQASLLRETTAKLAALRYNGDLRGLQYLLSGLLKRNHLGIDNPEMHTAYRCHTKLVIERFHAEVECCLKHITVAESIPLEDRLQFMQKAAKSLGTSALCLSGGGAIAMYHQGVILALLECGLYKDISVVSGTSGGSIMAAMCAMKTEQELRDEVIAPDVSTNYKRDGSMKREGISWFPPLMEQVARYLREGVLVDQKEFQRCCRFYYGDTTFGEAFAITGKHVSITVSASRSSSGPQRLLLNHISTPHVLLSSAVTASCSLPGIMKANILEAKDAEGNVVPFEVDGVEWIDGSVQADVPFRRMATVFSVSNFIVSQVNPHVVPFIHMQEKGNGDVRVSQNSFYWRLCRVLDMDMRSRVLALSNLGLMPRLFGQDMTRIFTQKYHGHITIVPKLILSESIGMRAIMNPSLKDMIRYISGGQRSTWPHIARIQHTIHLERILDRCITELKEQHFVLGRSYSSSNILDTMAQSESGTKSKVPMGFQWEWEIQKLRAHISRLEEENDSLRTVVKELAFVVGPRPRSQPSPHELSPPRVDLGSYKDRFSEEDEPPDEDPTQIPMHARRRSTGNLLGSPGNLTGAIPSRTPKKSNGISRSISLKYINESSVMDEVEVSRNGRRGGKMS